MVQQIAFKIATKEEFYEFIKEIRRAGVMKIRLGSVELDMVPGDAGETALDPDTLQKQQQIKDAFKTVQQLEQEALEDLNWSS